MQGKGHKVAFRRRRQGKTDYRQRLKLLKSRKARVIVRKSNKNIRVQFALYKPHGDFIITTTLGSDLRRYGWNGNLGNVPASYLTGYLAGKKASQKGINEGILDIGLHSPRKGARVFAALKGVVDAGIEVPYSEDILPDEERIHGNHIDESLAQNFEEVKKKIEEEYG
ncbi:MAG: 50S ribosomal protein L18 [Thermoplasmata archaeon]|nr:MAG: 50S ribosomal protein L18 [Thermoplasmata archaeon]